MKSTFRIFSITFISAYQVARSQLTGTKIVPEGGACGGETGFPIVCETGLTCVFPVQDPSKPQTADLPGVCRKNVTVAGVFESCDIDNQKKDIVTICKNGLSCVDSPQQKFQSVGPICLNIGLLGESCGGFAPPEQTKFCINGLVCVVPGQNPTKPQIGDLPGVCKNTDSTTTTSTLPITATISKVVDQIPTPIIVGEGESCGGLQGVLVAERICKSGLTCEAPIQDLTKPIIADLQGICKNTDATSAISTPHKTTAIIDHPSSDSIITESNTEIRDQSSIKEIWTSANNGNSLVGSDSILTVLAFAGILALIFF